MLDNAIYQANYSLFRFLTRDIHTSPPVSCDPGAPCEVHTMLGARDISLYLVAIKSLLRSHGAVAVVVHSDGTIDEPLAAALRRHIPGCRIVSASEADKNARLALGEESFLFQLRGFDLCYRRLVDTEVLGTAPRRIVMDSDVLVQGRPLEVLEWIERGDRPFLMGKPPTAPTPAAPPDGVDNRHVQSIFEEGLDRVGDAVGLPKTFLRGTTAGFYGHAGELGLGHIERVVKAGLELGIPMRQWGGDQCVVIYLLSAAGAYRLDPDRHFNFCPGLEAEAAAADIVHFFGTYRFYRGVYSRLAKRVVRELGRSAHPAVV